MKLICITKVPLALKDKNFLVICFFITPHFSIIDPMIKLIKLIVVLPPLITPSNKLRIAF